MAKSEEILTFSSDKERLDYIKDLIMKQIQTEIQQKLSTDAGAEQKFWELIEQIRKEELRHE
jgi:hypothetical protein